MGGGYNSTLSAGTITLATPLAAGSSVDVQFLLGVQATGTFRFFVNIEAIDAVNQQAGAGARTACLLPAAPAPVFLNQ